MTATPSELRVAGNQLVQAEGPWIRLPPYQGGLSEVRDEPLTAELRSSTETASPYRPRRPRPAAIEYDWRRTLTVLVSISGPQEESTMPCLVQYGRSSLILDVNEVNSSWEYRALSKDMGSIWAPARVFGIVASAFLRSASATSRPIG